MRIRIGDLLVKAGVITDGQLKQALAEQHQWGGKLGDILVRMEFVTEEVLVRALSKQSGIPRADLSGEAPKEALDKVPPEMAEEFGLVPLSLQDDGRTLVVAMSDPLNIMVTDHLRSTTGCRVVAQIAGTQAIRDAISRWYRGDAPSSEESIRIMNNAGGPVSVNGKGKNGSQPGPQLRVAAPPAAPAATLTPSVAPQAPSAVDVLRGVEETQRRSVAALKAMVELLIEKGVFSREEYLGRVKR